MSRRRGRELAMQMLFQVEGSESEPGDVEQIFWETRRAKPQAREFAQQLFSCAIRHRKMIDDAIRDKARHWKLERISPVERNILRVAVAEFAHLETARAVVIDEAIEIAKLYGTERSAEFVNGVLDAILEELEQSRV